MVLNASWRRHSTSDPRTVKTTAGTYKAAEKRCLTSTLEPGRWNRFYRSAVKTSARYSARPALPMAGITSGRQPAMDAFPHIWVPPHSALTLLHFQDIPPAPGYSEHWGCTRFKLPWRDPSVFEPLQTLWSSFNPLLIAVVTWEWSHRGGRMRSSSWEAKQKKKN